MEHAVSAVIAVIILPFAVSRVTNMLIREDGPFDVFVWLRAHIDPQQTTWVGRGLQCPLCVSFWVSLAFVILLYLSGLTLTGNIIIDWLGIAGIYLVGRTRGYLA